MLRAVARILQASRLADDCFRIGGDEFAILMPEAPAERARIAAEQIAAEIRDADLGDGELGVSFCIATSADPEEPALLEVADRALLEAKDRLYGRASA